MAIICNAAPAHFLQRAHEHASAAFWVRSDEDKQWQQEQAVEAMRKAALLYGFDLVPHAAPVTAAVQSEAA